MQRTKMPIKERAKIFAPFDALKGFREMLATEELIHEDRKELSEDQINLINDTINQLEFGMMIEVVYYVDKENCYKNGKFSIFDTTKPNSYVTFLSGYENCSLTCIVEDNLCVSLNDYNFGVIPGNTALTGLGDDYTSRIVLTEPATEETISERANIIAVKKSNINTPKTKALVDACSDERVANYIAETFGESVLYHYENLLA